MVDQTDFDKIIDRVQSIEDPEEKHNAYLHEIWWNPRVRIYALLNRPDIFNGRDSAFCERCKLLLNEIVEIAENFSSETEEYDAWDVITTLLLECRNRGATLKVEKDKEIYWTCSKAKIKLSCLDAIEREER
jgi:hypothetical protein